MKKSGYYFLIVANFCIYGLLNNAQSSEVLLSDTEAELQLAEQGTVALNLPRTDISNLTRHELVLGRWYEGGVVNRLQTDYFGNYQINEILSIELGVGVSMLEQWG